MERAHDFGFMVGACRSCEGEYVVAIVATLVTAPDSEFVSGQSSPVHQYLFSNLIGADQTFSVCRPQSDAGPLSAWILERQTTSFGIMDHHLLGPCAIAGDDAIQTPFGVSICSAEDSPTIQQASALVVAYWDGILTLNATAQTTVSASA